MGKTALVVDDCEISRLLVAQLLKSAGYYVLEAESGNKALSALDALRVDLLVSDFHMPGMNGAGLIKAMRRLPASCDIPMYILSSDTREETRQEALAAGATAWLKKPLDPRQILSLISS